MSKGYLSKIRYILHQCSAFKKRIKTVFDQIHLHFCKIHSKNQKLVEKTFVDVFNMCHKITLPCVIKFTDIS